MLRVPAEWESLASLWIAWPHNQDTWPGRFDPIAEFFRKLIRTVSETNPVRVIGSEAHRAESGVDNVSAALWIPIETNDCWIRDYGPTFLVDGSSRAAIDWAYNAWGEKYPPWDLDAVAARKIARVADWPRVEGGLCLEGGALEWDGRGRLLTTPCLTTETRNPGHSRESVFEHLSRVAGAQEIVWVDGGGLVGDDTDGHIDQLARFIDPSNVVVAVTQDTADPNHAGLEANHAILQQWAASTEPRVNVHRLPIPPARTVQGQRVPESYCNFLRLGGDRLLVPTFGHPASDDYAIGLLGELARAQSPQLEVRGIDCRDLVWGLGALHCATLNEPRVS